MRGPLALIEQSQEGSLPVVSIRGEVDVGNVPVVREWLSSASEQGRRDLVVDLRQVRFLAVGALYVLCDEHDRMSAHRARLTVICDSPQILKTMALCRVLDVLRVVASLDETPDGAWSAADERRAERVRDWIARYERPGA